MPVTVTRQPDLIEIVDRPSKVDRRMTAVMALLWGGMAWSWVSEPVQAGADMFSLSAEHGHLPRILTTLMYAVAVLTSLYTVITYLTGTRRDVRIWRFQPGRYDFITETPRGAQQVRSLVIHEIRAVKRKVEWPALYRVAVYAGAGAPYKFPWQRDRADRDALIAHLHQMFPDADVTSNA